MTSELNRKPGRPFGVTLAIGLSVLFYTIFPLMIVGSVLLVERHFSNAADNANPFGEAAMSGGDFRGGVTDTQLILQAGVAIAFLIIALITWRGRPAFMRYVFMASVLVMGAVAIVMSLQSSQGTADAGISGGSLDGVSDILELLGVIAQGMLIPLYVTWYLNRGPARAFFRGYYLDRSERGVYATKDNPTQQAQAAESTHT